jgi:hypothetical protein
MVFSDDRVSVVAFISKDSAWAFRHLHKFEDCISSSLMFISFETVYSREHLNDSRSLYQVSQKLVCDHSFQIPNINHVQLDSIFLALVLS